MRLTLSWQVVCITPWSLLRIWWLTQALGGSAGYVVAGRLAALDRNLTVLLIEGGENNLNNPWIPRDVGISRLF